MPTLKVSIVQSNLHWHDARRNREMFSLAIQNIREQTDLIVLPEMFTTGFSMDAPGLAEPMDGDTVVWMKQIAATHGAAVCGSVIVVDGNSYFNRFICVMPDGSAATYDKRHLFRLADEHSHYAPGNILRTFEIKGFRIRPMICYDLRFPVWSRNRGDYDLLLYVANWPSRRHNAWATLLRARAIENLSYLAGVNRVGLDGNDLPYIGGSAIIDYLGNDLVDLGDQEGTGTATLDLATLRNFRDKFPFDKDADEFALER
ncbi:MAG: amidohydrolase [Proteobacteria bacterium]|nr:amidohydrolase [Pseudomonadota bacterium]MDA0993533.1 amidohydrolase [Pseudomonadota bacterium]